MDTTPQNLDREVDDTGTRPPKSGSSSADRPVDEVLFEGRTHPKILFKPGIWSLVLIAVIVLDFIFVPGDWLSGGVRYAILGLAVLTLLVLAVVPVLQWSRGRHTVTARQLVVSSGILYRTSKTVPISRITSVDFEQGILDRIFGCGSLIVNDASANQPLRFHDVSSVKQVQDTLNELIHAQ
ncbi:PH domain-containing protein [Tomitella biformata]|uniref:PH domain-containing protein n=1 Tax=Tomitella biformata TaxID=630403 RepID=UPI000466BF8D|nr:PH domain-containing protein [Tomitella biformata]